MFSLKKQVAFIALVFGVLVTPFPLATAAQKDHPVDQFVARAGKTDTAASLIDDHGFVKRVWLNFTGRLPSFDQTQRFLRDRAPNKRARLVKEVMNSEAFATRWAYFWEIILWNQYIAGDAPLRNSTHFSLQEQIAANRPWDQLARMILEDRGALMRERSFTNFWMIEFQDDSIRLDYLDDQVSFISEAFLGVQMTCISCHDGAYHLEQVNKGLSVMKREQFWGLASFLAQSYFQYDYESYQEGDDFFQHLRLTDLDHPDFSEQDGALLGEERFLDGQYNAATEPGEGMRPVRVGGLIQPRYPFTGERPKTGETRRQALARMITADRQFARNLVNRVWKVLFGQAFVEPVNQWDLGRLTQADAKAFSSTLQTVDIALVEHLTTYFIDSGYDIKALLKYIAGSRLYQVDYAAVPARPEPHQPWADARRVKRLDAESILDNIHITLEIQAHYVVTGVRDRTFQSAWELPGRWEPNASAIFDEQGALTLDPATLGFSDLDDFFYRQYATMEFLDDMGRADRQNQLEASLEANALRSLYMLNNIVSADPTLSEDATAPMLKRLNDALEQGTQSTEQVVTEVFERVLFRIPSVRERQVAIRYLGESESETRLGDLVWSLFNHPDFLYH